MQSDDIPIDPDDPELAEKLHKEAKEGNVVVSLVEARHGR
jgi:hypothetical protein